MLKGIFSMDTLIGLASHILFVFSIAMSIINWDQPMYSYTVMWEAPAVLILVTNIGHHIESLVRAGSTKAYDELEAMQNSLVTLYKNKKETKVQASEVKVGDYILVKKGELIGLDGVVQTASSFNYSNITGESEPINLDKGAFVVSGSYNLGDRVLIKVTKDYMESTISTIIESIENITMAKPAMQKFADKILKWFVPGVIFIATTTFIVWITVTSLTDFTLPWVKQDSNIILSVSAAMTVIAIACPCALGIATPLVYTVSSTLASKNGILINNPTSLEELSRVKIFAFDKTGTITTDKFLVKSMIGNKKFIGIAKALEQDVHHPIAKTIMSIKGNLSPVTNITSKEDGVYGVWNKKKVSIKRYNEGNQGTTNVALYIGNKVELVFELSNIIKPGVKKTIALLNKNNIKVVMITGDNNHVSKLIADEVGIDVVYSNIKPNEKANIIKELQKEGKVAFVGDGFNDSVAIKQADVSIAFATGSDITNSLSDVSIIKDSFATINKVLVLSKMNNRWVKIALTYAFMFNVITIPVAFLLLVQPWVGASLMAISDILVASNALLYKVLGGRKLK
ncbi:MAG: cation-translocating P-type ATPase [Mycoplasmataceae bacterium]|nr:cation-translocating P-type ATPase [Mycoplasmataceae bacterium]